jgi:transposase-like protein
MRVTPSEKQEIIRLVERSELGVNRTLKELGIHKSTFYKWYHIYVEKGMDGLMPQKRTRRQWNSIPELQKLLVVEVALDHPQTQGKIERYHRSMKNIVKLNHYYCPDELIEALSKFVNYYNHERYHESLDNVTPGDVYWGKKDQILRRREKIKKQNMKMRRALYVTEKLNKI